MGDAEAEEGQAAPPAGGVRRKEAVLDLTITGDCNENSSREHQRCAGERQEGLVELVALALDGRAVLH